MVLFSVFVDENETDGSVGLSSQGRPIVSNTCYLSVHQSEGVVFADLAATNEKLAKIYGISELVEFYEDENPPGFTGWISQNAEGSVLLSEREEHEFGGYKETVEVWGCWSKKAAKLIADGMIEGKLVMCFDEEGHGESYTVITPGKVEEKSAPKVTF
jgi:hypothetical protein